MGEYIASKNLGGGQELRVSANLGYLGQDPVIYDLHLFEPDGEMVIVHGATSLQTRDIGKILRDFKRVTSLDGFDKLIDKKNKAMFDYHKSVLH